MKTTTYIIKTILLLFVFTVLFSCNKNDDTDINDFLEEVEKVKEQEEISEEELPTILDLIKANDELELFHEAIVKSGVKEILNTEDSLTVFAPNNTAITELFTLLGDEFNSFDDFNDFIEVEILKRIIQYHIVNQSIASKDLIAGTLPTLLDGDSIEIISLDSSFVIGDASEINANISIADNFTSNGVIHIIDKILIPSEIQELLELQNPNTDAIGEVLEQENYSFLKEALTLSELLNTLDVDDMELLLTLNNDSFSILFTLLTNTYSSLDEFDTNSEILELRNVILLYLSSIRAN